MGVESDIYDVAIVGGGPAGLSAALMLGRCRRKVIVYDHGQYRNDAARHLNGYLGHDGIVPAELRKISQAEIQRYNVKLCRFEVEEIVQCSSVSDRTRFRIVTKEGSEAHAKKIVLATGMIDELPD